MTPAGGPLGRARGLLGRRGLPAGQAALLEPCRAIHTCGMRFSLDVIFLDPDRRVVRIVRNVRPWRFVFGGRRAHSVLEMASGWLPADAVAEGEQVELMSE